MITHAALAVRFITILAISTFMTELAAVFIIDLKIEALSILSYRIIIGTLCTALSVHTGFVILADSVTVPAMKRAILAYAVAVAQILCFLAAHRDLSAILASALNTFIGSTAAAAAYHRTIRTRKILFAGR
jgi:hypothetical protein